MKNSRLLTIVGAVTVLAGSSAAAIGPRAALAGTTACGNTGIAGTSSCTYNTIGTDTFTVPPGVNNATFTVEGAQGGTNATGPAGGRGGRVSAALPLTPGQVLQVNVGGQGQATSASGGLDSGAGGGGSSDVRDGLFGLADRLLVAGGGGGAGGSGGNADPREMGGGGGWGGGGTAGAPGGAGAGRGGTTTTYGAGGAGMNGESGTAGGSYSGGSGGSLLPISLPILGGAGGTGGGAQGGTGEPAAGCAGGGGGGGWFGGGGGGATNCTGGGGGGGGGSNYVCPCASGGSSVTGFRSGHGQVTVSWQEPTTMTVAPAAASLSDGILSLTGLTATLTGPDGPLAGQPVTFTAGSTDLCTATTNADGMASCGATIPCDATSAWDVLQWLGYTVTYAGGMGYQGSTATGSLVDDSCGCLAHVTAFREGDLPVAHRTATATATASREDRVTAVM
jgi:hypothetical protein